MEKVFELGPIQKEWIKSLREHPERQTASILAQGDKDKYEACCLGELLMVSCRMKGIEPVFYKGNLSDMPIDGQHPANHIATLDGSYKELGLKGEVGPTGSVIFNGEMYMSLAALNDAGMPWPEIADFVEKHPERVFTKSV